MGKEKRERVNSQKCFAHGAVTQCTLPAAGLTPAYAGRLLLSLLAFGLDGGLSQVSSRRVLLQCCCLTGCCRIIAPGIWTRAGSAVSPCGSVGRGTQWDAGPLQLMLGFPSLPPCLQIFTSPLEPAHPTRMPGSPVRPLYHKLEERPVIVSQKFLVEAAEHLRRSKGGLFLASVPAETGTPQPCRTLRSQQ